MLALISGSNLRLKRLLCLHWLSSGVHILQDTLSRVLFPWICSVD